MKYDLNRFLTSQMESYPTALKEIKAGCKQSHWMWYIFPQIAGLGHSPTAKYYEIADLEEAKLYIDNDYLRSNLVEISQALLDCGDDNIDRIMGFPDNFKLCSCMTLFEIVAPEIDVFTKILNKFYEGKRDIRTLELASK